MIDRSPAYNSNMVFAWKLRVSKHGYKVCSKIHKSVTDCQFSKTDRKLQDINGATDIAIVILGRTKNNVNYQYGTAGCRVVYTSRICVLIPIVFRSKNDDTKSWTWPFFGWKIMRFLPLHFVLVRMCSKCLFGINTHNTLLGTEIFPCK